MPKLSKNHDDRLVSLLNLLYCPKNRGFARMVAPRGVSGDDVLQESAMRIQKSWEQCQSPGAWVKSVIRSAALDINRAARRGPRLVGLDAVVNTPAEPISSAMDPEKLFLAAHEPETRLGESINEMSGVAGEVARRRFLDGMAVKDIAQQLCLSDKRIYQILTKGIEILRAVTVKPQEKSQ